MKGRKVDRVVVFVGGWAAHRHVGDDAILKVHLESMQELDLGYEPVVLGSDPKALSARFGVRSAPGLDSLMSAEDGLGPSQRLASITGRGAALSHADLEAFQRELSRAAALIVLGAGALASRYSSCLWTQSATVEAARGLGVPVAIAGASLGPITDPLDAMFLRRMLRAADLVCVRDRTHSVRLAHRLGVRETVTEWDPAARMTPVVPKLVRSREGTARLPAEYAVTAVRPGSWREFGPSIDALREQTGLVTLALPMDFFPHEPDIDLLRQLRAGLRSPQALQILDPLPPDGVLAGLIARARLAFGARYHLALLAAAHGTPSVLVHNDEYSRVKTGALLDMTAGSVRACDAAAERIREAVLAEAKAARRAAIATPSLPAAEWLGELLIRSSRNGHPVSSEIRLEPVDDLNAARETWERLERRAANPFCTFCFASLWWSHLGNGRPLRLFIARRADGRPFALLPLFVAEDGEIPTWRFLGHFDADLLGPVCGPAERLAALRALGAALGTGPMRLIGDDLEAGSASTLKAKVLRRTASPVLDLREQNFEDVLSQLTSHHRKQIRWQERRLFERHRVRLREADEGTVERDMQIMLDLHRARWNGQSPVFEGQREQLHREFATAAATRGWLRLRLLEVDGRAVAAKYALRLGDAEWYFQAGRDPAWNRASVGTVLQTLCIRSAIEENASSYRWLRGDEPYKSRWPNREEFVETVLLER